MSIRKQWKLGAVAVSCAALGAGASVIASAGASTSHTLTPRAANGGHAGRAGAGGRALLRRAVHGDVVVATRTGYATVTFDRGIVKSVSGQQLTLADGRKNSTYKTVTLTIPATAKVRDNGASTTLAAVKPGQRAAVVQGPKRVLVIARTPKTP